MSEPRTRAEVFEVMKQAAKDSCIDCNGTGYVTIPASQIGGQIRDEQTVKCICRKGE